MMKILEKIRWMLFWLAMIPVCLIMCLVEGVCQLRRKGGLDGN